MFTLEAYEREWKLLAELMKIPPREANRRSRNKLRIKVTDVKFPDGDQKRWALVELLSRGSTFAPSFEDLFRMIVAIVHCENEKYPNLKWYPSDLVADFLLQAVNAADRLVGTKRISPEPDPQEQSELKWTPHSLPGAPGDPYGPAEDHPTNRIDSVSPRQEQIAQPQPSPEDPYAPTN